MKYFFAKFTGDDIDTRVRSGAFWSVMEFGGAQVLRLAANLVMTRLLFPEAFGLMALVAVVTTGLSLFSDTGIKSSIIQNRRGDDPDFLNTAWTIQVVRGLLLWGLTLILAGPIAALYDEPLLAHILPIAGLALLFDGFQPTSVHTANRHLYLGRFTQILLVTQALTLVVMAFLAWQFQSVWALVIGGVIGSALRTLAFYAFLPGIKNRPQFERKAFWQLFHFGKWLFLSSAAGFVMLQGDRAILGLYISLEALGIYNIGYFLASVPLMLSRALENKVVFPLYRMRPVYENLENRRSLFRARRLLALSMMAVAALLAFSGPILVEFLYDPRYLTAGAIITLFSVSVMPMVCLNAVTAATMAAGDTRATFFIVITEAVSQTALLLLIIPAYGVPGALFSPVIATLLAYPLRLFYSLKYNVFDPVQDIGLTGLGLTVAGMACVLHWNEVASLF